MKALRLFLLILMAAAVLCGCQRKQTVFESTWEGKTITVYTKSNTITDGTNTSSYQTTGISSENASYETVVITYPDGAAYQRKTDKVNGEAAFEDSWSEGYEAEKYIPGHVLMDALEAAESQNDHSPKPSYIRIVLGVIVVLIGSCQAIFAEDISTANFSPLVQDPTPTEKGVKWTRQAGIAIIMLGLIIIFMGFVGNQ